MAKEKNGSNGKNGFGKKIIGNYKLNLKEEAKQAILAIIFAVLSFFFLLAAFDKAGIAGSYAFNGLSKVFGVGYYLLPILLLLISVFYFRLREERFGIGKIIGAILFFIASLGILGLIKDMGGLVGEYLSNPLVQYFDFISSYIFLVALLIISCLIIFNTKPNRNHLESFFSLFRGKTIPETLTPKEEEMIANNVVAAEEVKAEDQPKPEPKKPDGIMDDITFMSLGTPYIPPPLSILEMDRGKPGVGDIKANANIIKRTLQNFGITVEMDEISIGPSVTRYALKPAEGVKLSKITGLQDNLSLALSAHPLRIEAPIPGKSLVGIEIPNKIKTLVGLGSLLQSPEYQDSDIPLLVALGKGVSGKTFIHNMAKMPHLLIAGATGSGKSVTIHALINSLLFRNSPENLRFIMIDPKRVELTLYNGIPHLLTPVITDAKKSIISLKWAAKEMDRRYDILQENSVRDIDSYHKSIVTPAIKKKEQVETMPYIMIVIDELADIMHLYPRELEAGIIRLAQMSRAVGIHLMVSTQRPSVKIITGLIKANIPARLALQVASNIDSRTILDQGGAENLLGAGDMLYLSGDMPNPERIQSAFITEGEVKKVVKYLKDSYEKLPTEINLSSENLAKDPVFAGASDITSSLESGNEDVDDDLYEEVREEIIRTRKASTSYIQRRFKVGYGRAARLLDILEGQGVIGPGQGSRPRDVLVPYEGVGADYVEEETPVEAEVEEQDEESR